MGCLGMNKLANVRVFRNEKPFMTEVHHMDTGSEEELKYFTNLTYLTALQQVTPLPEDGMVTWRVESAIVETAVSKPEPELKAKKIHRPYWNDDIGMYDDQWIEQLGKALNDAGIEEGDGFRVVPLKIEGDCPACGTLAHLVRIYGDS